eukprot:COSAG02_NODE_15772_length_1142_cov_1.123682_2_plen_143_part_01
MLHLPISIPLRAVALHPPVRSIVVGSEAYTPVHSGTIVQQQQVVPIEAQFHTKPDLVRHDLLQFFICEQRFVAGSRRGKLNCPDLGQASGRVIPHDRLTAALATFGRPLAFPCLGKLEREPFRPRSAAPYSPQTRHTPAVRAQ